LLPLTLNPDVANFITRRRNLVPRRGIERIDLRQMDAGGRSDAIGI